MGMAATAWGQEESPPVPSGLSLRLQEVLVEEQFDGTRWARFRYVADDLAGHDFADVEADFPALCAEQVVPWSRTAEPAVDKAVISLASAALDFGESDPEVTQFFEVYAIRDGSCIWEGL